MLENDFVRFRSQELWAETKLLGKQITALQLYGNLILIERSILEQKCRNPNMDLF